MPRKAPAKIKQHNYLQDASQDEELFINLHHPPISSIPQNSANQLDFYEQYKKVLGISHEIHKQLIKQNQLKTQLMGKVTQLQKNMQNNVKTAQQNKQQVSIRKRNRRMAQQIERAHKCSVQFCQKQYGSEGSLLQHIKLKHPQMYYANL